MTLSRQPLSGLRSPRVSRPRDRLLHSSDTKLAINQCRGSQTSHDTEIWTFAYSGTVDLLIMHVVMAHICHNASLFGYNLLGCREIALILHIAYCMG